LTKLVTDNMYSKRVQMTHWIEPTLLALPLLIKIQRTSLMDSIGIIIAVISSFVQGKSTAMLPLLVFGNPLRIRVALIVTSVFWLRTPSIFLAYEEDIFKTVMASSVAVATSSLLQFLPADESQLFASLMAVGALGIVHPTANVHLLEYSIAISGAISVGLGHKLISPTKPFMSTCILATLFLFSLEVTSLLLLGSEPVYWS
jgi:hypothetical protein